MINSFAILLIIFIVILLLVLKKRSFKKLINQCNLNSIQLKKNNKSNNKFLSKKNSYLYNPEKKSTQHIIKIFKEIKCLVFSKGIQKIN